MVCEGETAPRGLIGTFSGRTTQTTRSFPFSICNASQKTKTASTHGHPAGEQRIDAHQVKGSGITLAQYHLSCLVAPSRFYHPKKMQLQVLLFEFVLRFAVFRRMGKFWISDKATLFCGFVIAMGMKSVLLCPEGQCTFFYGPFSCELQHYIHNCAPQGSIRQQYVLPFHDD